MEEPRRRRRPKRTVRLSDDRALLEIRFRYDEALKDAIKRIPGAQWAPDKRIWVLEAHHAAELLHLLAEHGFDIADDVTALAARGGNNARMRQLRRAARTDSLTPTTLNAQLAAQLRAQYPDRFWVIGQISDWKNRGYFELIEKYEDEYQPRARISAYIAERDYDHIQHLLAGMRPALSWGNRLKVRLKGQLSYREAWGSVQLRVVDIDPHYTITLLNEAREEALRALDEEGLSERNLDLELPPVPLRVALITPESSEAGRDFIEELRESGYGFTIDTYPAKGSGPQQERTTLAALARIAARADDYDVLAIVRGGGNQSGLMGFDQLSIGRAVCTHPLPVVCGIGHERDHTLIDDIARSCKTPTKAAVFLVAHVQAFVDELGLLQERIGRLAGDAARQARDELAGLARRIGHEAGHTLRLSDRALRDVELDIRRGVRGRLSRDDERLARMTRELPERWGRRRRREARELGHLERRLSPQRMLGDLRREGALLDASAARLLRATQGRLRGARQSLAAMSARREAADPARVLERGFAVVTRPGGALVRDAQTVSPGEALVVRLGAGQMNVTRDEDAGDE